MPIDGYRVRQRNNVDGRKELLQQTLDGSDKRSTVSGTQRELFQGIVPLAEQSNGKKWSYAQGVIVFLVAFGGYGNSIYGEFLHDDNPAILNNPDVQGKSSLVEVFSNDFWGMRMTSNRSHKSYRPLCALTFRLEHFLFGFNPVLFHITNVLLHSVVSTLVIAVCRNVVLVNGCSNRHADCSSFICGLLFALHPIHTEAVANLVGRAELMSAFFYLLAFLSHAASLEEQLMDKIIFEKYDGYKIKRTWKNSGKAKNAFMLLLALLSSGCATFSKETGITILGVMFLREFHSIFRRYKQASSNLGDFFWPLTRTIIIATWTLILIYVRLSLMKWMLPHFALPDNPASKSPYIRTRFLTYSFLSWLNFKLLIFPKDLLYDWSYGTVPLVTSLFDSRNVITAGFAIFFIVVISIILSNDLPKSRISPRLYGLFFLIFPYIPASNFFFPVGFVIAERTLYLPSFGYVILVVLTWQKLHSRCDQARPLLKFSLLLLLMLYGSRTWSRNEDWLTKKNLFQSAMRVAPQNAKVRYNWANYLRDIGKYEAAATEYEETLKLYPSYAGALNNLATILEMNESTIARAEKLYVQLIRSEPTRPDAYRNLADILVKTKRFTAAVDVYSRLLDNVGTHVSHVLTLAELLRKSNETEHAERLFLRVLTQFCEVWKQDHVIDLLRNISSRRNIAISSSNCFQKSSEISPALAQYSKLLLSKGSLTESASLLKFSLIINDSHVDSLVTLGWINYKVKNFSQSEKYLIRAFRLDKTEIDQAWKLAEYHYQDGRVEESRKVLERLVVLVPENMHLATQYALILNESGDRQKALGVLSGVTTADAACDNIGAWIQLAKTMKAQQEIGKGRAILQECLRRLNDRRGKHAKIVEKELRKLTME